MGFLQILAIILQLAPDGINLTAEIVKLIQEIEGVVGAVPTEHQAAVANMAAKALVAKV
jgi:hypothetical protein